MTFIAIFILIYISSLVHLLFRIKLLNTSLISAIQYFQLYLQAGNSDVKDSGDISKRLLTKLEWLFDKVLNDHSMQECRVLPQLHALIWNNDRGK